MGERRRIIVLILIMAVVATVIGGVAIWVLYETAFAQKREDLIQTAQSQARLMEAVARFDRQYSQFDHPQGAAEATISQVRDAHQQYEGFGKTGEFTLARRQGDWIVFLLSHRYHDLDKPKPVPWDSKLAGPMRHALHGHSGTLVGLDYRGEKVLAAYEPVSELDLGIVAKIDLAEIRAPFLKAGGSVAVLALVVIVAGTVVFFWVSNPMIRRIHESEERLHRAILDAPIPVMLHTEPGEVLMINNKWTKLTGYTHEEIPTIDEWTKRAYGGKPPVIAEALKKAYSVDADTVDEGTFVVTIASGEKRIWTFYSSLLGSTAKGDVLLITTVQDITERKQAEEALLAAKEEAERANRAKSDFLAVMSHELRSPLNAVIGFAEIIKDQIFGPAGQPQYVEYAGDIHASGLHLLGLINDVLDLSKIEAGKQNLDEENIGVAEVVESSLRLVRERIKHKGLTLRLDLGEGRPTLRADRSAVQQMLLNLLTNAVEFTPEGGRISVGAAVEDGGAITLSVADTGIGIADDDIPTVLAPFGQTKNLATRDTPGTGLGIPIVMSLIELHGGSFALDSAPGAGTTARLRFPAARTVR